ncbi:MAG: hypothetical protein IVW54_04205 [Candidatus Binataceae bacterium]|nr:hypothetical protein [Candidatus Binataceae bacterium]
MPDGGPHTSSHTDERSVVEHKGDTGNKESLGSEAFPSPSGEHLTAPTLYNFYADKRTNPAGFLKSLKQGRVKTFDSEDTRRVLQNLDTLDPSYNKTLGLAQRIFASGSSSPLYWCLEWVGSAVLRGSEPLRSFSVDQSQSAEDLLREISRTLEPIPRNKKLARRSLNQLLCAVLWLAGVRGLDFFRAAEILSGFLSLPKSSTVSSQVQRSSFQQLSRLATTPRLLGSVFIFATPWIFRANAAQSDSQRSAMAVADLRDELRQFQTSLRESEQSNSELRKTLDIEVRRSGELAEKVRGGQITSKHELLQLCARSRGFLEKLKTSYLSTALDAAKLQPPSVTVIQERIDLALESIETEMEKLRKDISNA